MNSNIYFYIAAMASITYLIRMIPLVLIRKEIRNRFIKSFLYYVPYVTLAVMTFPAILHATSSIWSGLCAFLIAAALSYTGKSLFKVACFSCIAVYLIERFLTIA